MWTKGSPVFLLLALLKSSAGALLPRGLCCPPLEGFEGEQWGGGGRFR